MANNYCEFSTIYPITEENQEIALKTIQQLVWEWFAEEQGKESVDDLTAEERENAYAPFEYNMQEEGLWIYSEEVGDPDCAAEMIAKLQVELDATQIFTFSFSFSCSKPRVDEFGGGTFAITPDGEVHFAGNIDDAIKKANEYAEIAWQVEDVRTLRPDISDEEARDFLKNNRNHIQDRLTEMGWDLLEILLNEDGITKK